MPTKKTTPAAEPAAKQTRASLQVPKKEQAAASAEAGFKLPKTLAACADLMYKTRQERYELKARMEELQKLETALGTHLIENLPKSDALGVKGKLAVATIKETDYLEFAGPAESDRFGKLYAYILANAKKNPGVWALLQRRIGEAAAKEMITAGQGKLIGYKIGKIKTVGLTKL